MLLTSTQSFNPFHILEVHNCVREAKRIVLCKTRYVPSDDVGSDGSSRFEVEETPYLDAEGLRDALRKAGDGFADTLLNEVGLRGGTELSPRLSIINRIRWFPR